MDRVVNILSASVLLGLQLTPALAADVSHGQELAQRWCAGCHVVALNAARSTDVPPPFAVIARRPDFDASRLAYFLLNPHPVMPDMALSRNEAMDLAAYIASLRQ